MRGIVFEFDVPRVTPTSPDAPNPPCSADSPSECELSPCDPSSVSPRSVRTARKSMKLRDPASRYCRSGPMPITTVRGGRTPASQRRPRGGIQARRVIMEARRSIATYSAGSGPWYRGRTSSELRNSIQYRKPCNDSEDSLRMMIVTVTSRKPSLRYLRSICRSSAAVGSRDKPCPAGVFMKNS